MHGDIRVYCVLHVVIQEHCIRGTATTYISLSPAYTQTGCVITPVSFENKRRRLDPSLTRYLRSRLKHLPAYTQGNYRCERVSLEDEQRHSRIWRSKNTICEVLSYRILVSHLRIRRRTVSMYRYPSINKSYSQALYAIEQCTLSVDPRTQDVRLCHIMYLSLTRAYAGEQCGLIGTP